MTADWQHSAIDVIVRGSERQVAVHQHINEVLTIPKDGVHLNNIATDIAVYVDTGSELVLIENVGLAFHNRVYHRGISLIASIINILFWALGRPKHFSIL